MPDTPTSLDRPVSACTGFRHFPATSIAFDHAQLSHEAASLVVTVFRIAEAKQIGRVNGDEKRHAAPGSQHPAAFLCQTDSATHERVKSRDPKSDDETGTQNFELAS